VRDEFLKTLSERIEAVSNLIIGGDFNSVEDLKLDKTGQSANSKNTSKSFLEQLRVMLEVKDVYRTFHSSGKDIIFYNKPFRWELD
jgi:exonuclease III